MVYVRGPNLISIMSAPTPRCFGFDLDNTLASSKQPMKPAMIERFCALLDHTVVA